MSDTPRTDAAASVTFDPHGLERLVPSSFARELERELAKAIAVLELIRDAGGTSSKDAEYGKIDYNGDWCAEQARQFLSDTFNNGRTCGETAAGSP